LKFNFTCLNDIYSNEQQKENFAACSINFLMDGLPGKRNNYFYLGAGKFLHRIEWLFAGLIQLLIFQLQSQFDLRKSC
jgi:hypothetical protein